MPGPEEAGKEPGEGEDSGVQGEHQQELQQLEADPWEGARKMHPGSLSSQPWLCCWLIPLAKLNLKPKRREFMRALSQHRVGRGLEVGGPREDIQPRHSHASVTEGRCEEVRVAEACGG